MQRILVELPLCKVWMKTYAIVQETKFQITF